LTTVLAMVLRLFNGLFSNTSWVSRHQKGKPFWIFMKQEMIGGSGISWTICKSFVPRSSQIISPLSFYRPGAPATQPTASKHWRH